LPRTKRYFGTSRLNHCIIRGINKSDIFFDEQDRYKFIKVLLEFKEKHNVKIGAYVLMQNHVHLVTECDNEKISDFFHSILISYSSYFNKKYERVGHLFENRYRNKPIETEEYLRNVVKYIHFNPEKAGICKASNYKWSSYKEFFKKDTWIDKDMILYYYSENLDDAIKIFEKEHCGELNQHYENYVEFEMVDKLTDDQVKCMIDDIEKSVLQRNHSIWDDSYKSIILKETLKVKGVSLNQISRVTGTNRKILNRLKSV